ncbi:MAG TPA: NADH-quinone oxidoreductase subunit N [Actinomycetota bacterium]|nr:NADH-quinone oxidoreductase subunit N [Actinomycetota bacterium]
MPLNLPDVQLAAIAPEIALTVAALVLLVVDGFVGDRTTKWYLPALSTAGLLVAMFLAQRTWVDIGNDGPELQLAGMAAVDRFSIFVKMALAVFGILSVWLGREYLVKEHLEEAEYYGLVLFAVAGMMLMATAADLIVMFIALETFSVAVYVLVGFRRRSLISQESAMKYFLLGAFSSAFFLLGIAFVYGATGSTNLYGAPGSGTEAGIVQYLTSTATTDVGFLLLAVAFLIIGLGFKVAAVPFHMWTPDAYQGAPSPVTGFMAAGTKLAAFAALLRLLDVSLFQLRADWRPIVIAIAVVTMIVGSILAVVQEDIKRLLAYSSIAHAGFVLTAIVAANDGGVSGALFYLATYGLTIIGAFAVVTMVGGPHERNVRLADYRGLFYQRPLLAGALTLFLLSLAGVPLTSGFIAKLVVFGPAIDSGYTWLVVVGMIASAIAAFFYLRIMVVMYMQEPDEGSATPRFGAVASSVVAVTGVATIVLGLAWSPLFEIAERATIYFFAGP